MEAYRLELPGDYLDFEAPDDLTACAVARGLLQARGIITKQLHLYRLPITWVARYFGDKVSLAHDAPQMVWVWLFNFITYA